MCVLEWVGIIAATVTIIVASKGWLDEKFGKIKTYKVEIGGEGIADVSFHEHDHYVPPDQGWQGGWQVARVLERRSVDGNKIVKVRAGVRSSALAAAKFCEGICYSNAVGKGAVDPHQTPDGALPRDLIFTITGDMTFTLTDKKSITCTDMRIARGGDESIETWWLGSGGCQSGRNSATLRCACRDAKEELHVIEIEQGESDSSFIVDAYPARDECKTIAQESKRGGRTYQLAFLGCDAVSFNRTWVESFENRFRGGPDPKDGVDDTLIFRASLPGIIWNEGGRAVAKGCFLKGLSIFGSQMLGTMSVVSNTNTRNPGELNFAVGGEFSCTIDNHVYVCPDFRIGQGNVATFEDYWLASSECLTTTDGEGARKFRCKCGADHGYNLMFEDAGGNLDTFGVTKWDGRTQCQL
jgi:hypothetical protein